MPSLKPALALVCAIAYYDIALAMIALPNEKFDLLYMYDYDIAFCCCIPQCTIKNKLVLIAKQQNATIAQARYKVTYFNSTAELRHNKNQKWFDDPTLKEIFLTFIIQDIQERYPHISRLEYPHKNIAWDFV